jgi:hypothetical protein
MLGEATRSLLTAVVQGRAPQNRQDFSDLVRAIVDWDEVIDVGRKHRLLPLLYLRVNETNAPVPPAALERIRVEHDRNAFRNLANAAELVSLQRSFGKQHIPAMPFKGIVLAASAYPSLTIRSAGDLDFLVFHRDLSRATSMLVARGYELKTEVREDGSPKNSIYFEFHFEREADGMVVELRWKLELIQPRFGRDLGMDWVWPRRSTVNVGGVQVPNLDPVSTLLILCMHGTKHFWSRMIWVYDLVRVLETNAELDWKEAMRDAKQRGLWRALALGVLLARGLCGATVPERVLKRFRSDRAARELSEYFQNTLLETPGQMPPGRIPYSLRILDSGDRAQWLLRMKFLRPNQRDLAVVRLPLVLKPLYLLLRPFRILFDRSAR